MIFDLQMKNYKILLTVLVLSAASAFSAKAQNVAIKTNLLYDATATINAGVEVGLAPKWTLDLSGNLNAWNWNSGMRLKHYLIQPELRYWFCERFNGSFLGVHALGGQYNIGKFPPSIMSLPIIKNHPSLANSRYQGWYVGAGVAYGYSFILSKHWNLELELGAGYIYTRYDVFECKDCDKKVVSDRPKHYVGPTKAAINLIYEF